MSELRYEPKSKAPLKLESDFYPVFLLFSDRELNAKFMQLKANICDLNPALVTKCITGTEQDFIMLMDRAKDFIRERLRGISEEEERKLLEMFRQCVFGYYVLTPLVEAKEVSDIKVLDYDHIVVRFFGTIHANDAASSVIRLRVRQGEELFINALSARERESLQRLHSDMIGGLGPA